MHHRPHPRSTPCAGSAGEIRRTRRNEVRTCSVPTASEATAGSGRRSSASRPISASRDSDNRYRLARPALPSRAPWTHRGGSGFQVQQPPYMGSLHRPSAPSDRAIGRLDAVHPRGPWRQLKLRNMDGGRTALSGGRSCPAILMASARCVRRADQPQPTPKGIGGADSRAAAIFCFCSYVGSIILRRSCDGRSPRACACGKAGAGRLRGENARPASDAEASSWQTGARNHSDTPTRRWAFRRAPRTL